MRRNHKGKNYLDMIPRIKAGLKWKQKENGTIEIIKENKGLLNKIAITLYGMPKETRVSLDQYGNFVWLMIDGEKTIFQIAEQVKEKFGENAEPLYERLCTYFKSLEANGFVEVS